MSRNHLLNLCSQVWIYKGYCVDKKLFYWFVVYKWYFNKRILLTVSRKKEGYLFSSLWNCIFLYFLSRYNIVIKYSNYTIKIEPLHNPQNTKLRRRLQPPPLIFLIYFLLFSSIICPSTPPTPLFLYLVPFLLQFSAFEYKGEENLFLLLFREN